MLILFICRINNGTSVASMVLSTQVGERGATSQSLRGSPVQLSFTFDKVSPTEATPAIPFVYIAVRLN